MKKFYIVLLFFSVALTLSAQEERSSLLSENRRWTICSWTSPSQSGTKLYYEYVLRGDTTINGIRFKQSYKRRVDGASAGFVGGTAGRQMLCGHVREREFERTR